MFLDNKIDVTHKGSIVSNTVRVPKALMAMI